MSEGKSLSAFIISLRGLMTFPQLILAYLLLAPFCVPCEDATCIFNLTPGAVVKHPVG